MIFIAWIVFIPLEQKTSTNHVKNCENKDFCNVIMLSEDNEILEFNEYQKSYKAPFIIYDIMILWYYLWFMIVYD